MTIDKNETKTVYSYGTDGKYISTKVLDYTDRSPIDGTWQIPGNTTELVPEAKTGYDAYFISGAWAYIAQEVDVLCYYNNGTQYKTVISTYSVAAGEVIFPTIPTTAQLKVAFPSTAGSKTSTVNNIGVIGDAITIGGVTIACTSTAVTGTSYAVGTDTAGTVANIAACLNSNSTFKAVYKATVSGATITITEIKKGNGDNPADATYTGTITLTSGTAIASVWGYTTSILNQNLASINAVYNAEMLQIIRADNLAALKGNSTTDHTAQLTALTAWLDAEQEAAINEQ